MLLNEKEFGKVEFPLWRTICKSEQQNLFTAKLQHNFAFEIRRSIRGAGKTIKSFSEEIGQSYGKIQRALSGSEVMSLKEIGSAIECLNISTFVQSKYSTQKDLEKLAGYSSEKKEYGAFYTPDIIADYMTRRLHPNDGDSLLEPSFGEGSFLRAALRSPISKNQIFGVELDDESAQYALNQKWLIGKNLFHGDFFEFEPPKPVSFILGNPPYVRLRSLSDSARKKALETCNAYIDFTITEEASLWLPFLVKSIQHLADKGSMGFVLPYEITYVKYARPLWAYIKSIFSSLAIVRVKDRIFNDLLQDVVLFFAFGKGGSCESVDFECFDDLEDLESKNYRHLEQVDIEEIASGQKAFLSSFVTEPSAAKALSNNEFVAPFSQEGDCHIGYVSGNKRFFHPSPNDQEAFRLPAKSLRKTLVGARETSGSSVYLSGLINSERLWVPGERLTKSEKNYVAYGETMSVNEGYKCSKRKDWYRVPQVRESDLVLSVFCDTPKLLINDDRSLFSNSFLGFYLNPGIDARSFAASWYTVLTLLSSEIEIHSLGGGVLIAVPSETRKIRKLKSSLFNSSDTERRLEKISKALQSNRLIDAYHVGDDIVESLFGKKALDALWDSVNGLQSWRKR